jgi:RimJ/RimL family protein N-acetyltransferase
MPERILFGDKNDGRRIAQAADVSFDETKDVVISHVRDGRLTGGVLLTGFTDASCIMHVAAFRRRWGSRDMLWVCFDFPFNQCDLERVFGVVPETNRTAIAFDLHIGFREVARIANRYRGGGADIIFAMERDACPWLRIQTRTIRSGIDDGRIS